jgi:hypothetical protein
MKTTKENYFDRVKAYGVNKLPEKLQKVHTYIGNATQNGKDWSLYKSNEKITQLIDAQFSKLDEVFEKSGVAEKKSSTVDVEKKSANDKKPTTPPDKKKVLVSKNDVVVKKEVVQRSSKTPAVKSGEAVESLDPHLVILSQYLNLSKKQVPITRVSSFARRLTRMIENRTLRKASPHSKHIEKMRDNIMHILESNKGAVANVEISGAEKSAIEKVIAQQHKMKSVQLLSRYAGMAAKPITVEKAKRLYNTMFVTVEREQIPQTDRYFDRVIETMKFLKKYVEANNEKKQLPLLPAELSGILGCGCREPDEQPKSLNGIEPQVKSGEDELQNEVSETDQEDSRESDSSRRRIVNSMEFVNQHFDLLPIDEPYSKLFMPFARGAYFMVYGMDKQGKSALCIDFAGYLAQKFGEVLYVASEEGLSPTLQVKLTKFGRPAYKLDLADFLPDDLSGYNFLFLDSVTDLHLTPEDLHNIRQDYPDLTIFAIFHVNKEGRHAGKNTYAHNVEQKIHIIGEGLAESTGRYGKSEAVNFFNWTETP